MEPTKEFKTEELLKVIIVENTPFTLLKFDEGGYKIACRNQIVCENDFETEEEAKAYIDSKPYQLIIIATVIWYEARKKLLDITGDNDTIE